jgi:hypothetical protein
MSNVYKDALNKANQDLAEAISNRDRWTFEVARLQQLVASLTAMTATSNTNPGVDALKAVMSEVGLQEIILTCVRNSCPTPLSATEVRNQIRLGGLADLSKYANPLAVIHGALKRLVAQHKIREVPEGKYRMPVIYEGLIMFQRTKK